MPKKTSNKKPVKKKQKTSYDTALLAAKGAENKKAEDITIIDVSEISSVCDYILVCSASSAAQIKAISAGIDEMLEKNKIKTSRWRGDIRSNWIITDLFDVVVHVIGKEERSRYNLEELWEKNGIIYHI